MTLKLPRLQLRGVSASTHAFGGVALVSLCLLALQGRHYYPFMAEDAFISLRYSHRLLQGNGLTWNSHERVEGYTNLLWVFLCSFLGAGGRDLVHAARPLGIISTLAAWLVLAVYTWRSDFGITPADLYLRSPDLGEP